MGYVVTGKIFGKEALKEEQLSSSKLAELKKLKRDILISGCSLSCHAETSALNKYYKKSYKKNYQQIPLSKLTLVVIRVDAENNLIESKPCSQCIQKIHESGIKKVSYSTNSGIIVTQSVKSLIEEARPSRANMVLIRLLDEINDCINSQ